MAVVNENNETNFECVSNTEEDTCPEQINGENECSSESGKDDDCQYKVINHLYTLEKRVEKLRDQTFAIEQEKCSLLEELQRIQDNQYSIEFTEDQRDEVEALTERLVCRCLTVEVGVTTPRNEAQESALQRVNELLEQLDELWEQSHEKAFMKTKAYLNACLSEPIGSIDQRFQGAVLGCTLDDQKKVKFRLQTLLKDYDKELDTL